MRSSKYFLIWGSRTLISLYKCRFFLESVLSKDSNHWQSQMAWVSSRQQLIVLGWGWRGCEPPFRTCPGGLACYGNYYYRHQGSFHKGYNCCSYTTKDKVDSLTAPWGYHMDPFGGMQPTDLGAQGQRRAQDFGGCTWVTLCLEYGKPFIQAYDGPRFHCGVEKHSGLRVLFVCSVLLVSSVIRGLLIRAQL